MHLPRRLLVALTLVASLVAVPAASAPAAKKPVRQITVMTRNLFLGGNLIPLALAQPGDDFERAAGKLFDDVKATEPDARMKLVAGEIANAHPDLVGLQEVTLWRTGPKNDGKPATNVQIDYLATIMKELKRRGAAYRVVADQRTLDLEGPTDRGFDIRFTDGNVVLARKGVKVTNSNSSDFRNQLVIPTAAVGDVHVNRSFNQLDAQVGKARIHFVNAHLEAYSTDFRLKQAKELVAGPLKSRKGLPTVLVGDLNSGPKLPKQADRPPYLAIAAAGFKEARTPALNCCFNDDLVSGQWDHIVDHIMTRPKFKLVRSFITGAEKTAGGKAPSDHGGVVSVLRLP